MGPKTITPAGSHGTSPMPTRCRPPPSGSARGQKAELLHLPGAIGPARVLPDPGFSLSPPAPPPPPKRRMLVLFHTLKGNINRKAVLDSEVVARFGPRAALVVLTTSRRSPIKSLPLARNSSRWPRKEPPCCCGGGRSVIMPT